MDNIELEMARKLQKELLDSGRKDLVAQIVLRRLKNEIERGEYERARLRKGVGCEDAGELSRACWKALLGCWNYSTRALSALFAISGKATMAKKEGLR